MQDEQPKKPIFSRPKDRSLEAFKSWIGNMVDKIKPGVEDNSMSEQDWIEAHKAFWEKVEKTVKPSD